MDEKDWLILKTLKEKKSITKTAAAVFISQPALSKRLRQIEERFGVTLAARGKSGIELTPEGELLASCAADFLDRVRDMGERLKSMHGELRGTLRIGASNFCTRYVLPDVLTEFKGLHPMVEFHIDSGWSSDIARMVHSGDLHAGFIRNEHMRLEKKRVFLRERTYICSRRPIDMARLPEEPQICHKTDPQVRAKFNTWWAANYERPPRISMEVDQVNTCAEMVARGLGYGILSELVVDRMPEIHKYEMFHSNGEPYYREVWLISNATVRQLRLADAFIEFAENFRFGNELDRLRTAF